MTVVTRFAPSPTGYLHVGGARTALYAWLHARKHGGKFVLRIEDTDRERSTDESIQAILDGMQWLGLDYDEGPHYQTQRMDRYDQVIQQLLDTGHAYRCTCTRERLDEVRTKMKELGLKPRYDGHCRDKNLHADTSEPFVIRFRNPEEGTVSFDDLVRGHIEVSNQELDDLIIARSDGTPTYNLTVVVDDFEMGITQVIRGDDHINNTPRQINILGALGAPLPEYAHVPMILGTDGQRLSKRHGAVSVLQYRDDGYLPGALLNYLVRLGWSHGDQEFFTVEDMVELFNVPSVNRAASTFNMEKLQWLNQQHMLRSHLDDLGQLLATELERRGVAVEGGPDAGLVAEALRERAKTLVEMADAAVSFYQGAEPYDEKAAKKAFKAAARAPLELLRSKLAVIDDWQAEHLHRDIEAVVGELEIGFGKVGQPLRVALTGSLQGPSLDVIMHLLGKEQTLARIDRALAVLPEPPVSG